MQLSMLGGLDLYSLRRVLSYDDDRVARSRPFVNTRPIAIPLMTPRCFGYFTAGLANFAASMRAFGCTVVSAYTLRPSSQLIVHLNGIFTPVLPTSR